MARAETVSVSVRLPVGLVAILDDAVRRGMFTSTSDAIRALITRSLMVTNPEPVRGSIESMNLSLVGGELKAGQMNAIDGNVTDAGTVQSPIAGNQEI